MPWIILFIAGIFEIAWIDTECIFAHIRGTPMFWVRVISTPICVRVDETSSISSSE